MAHKCPDCEREFERLGPAVQHWWEEHATEEQKDAVIQLP